MRKNWVFNSIFGADEPVIPPAPAVPIIDDPRDPLSATKRTGAADSLIRQLERDAAIKAIFGSEVGHEILSMVKNTAVQPVASPPIEHIAARAVADLDFSNLVKRVASVLRKAPEHRRATQAIVDSARTRLRKYEAGNTAHFDALYNGVADSMAAFVQSALIRG